MNNSVYWTLKHELQILFLILMFSVSGEIQKRTWLTAADTQTSHSLSVGVAVYMVLIIRNHSVLPVTQSKELF